MQQTATLLVVEDDAFTGRMMDLQFSKAGYEVVLANNGEEALAQLEKQPFDLILTDVMMPGISGLDVLRRVRERWSKDVLPVILLTALDNAKSILEGLNDGANDFLGKTNEFGIVLAKVEHHLRVRDLASKASGSGTSREPVAEEGMVRLPEDCLWNWQLVRNVFKPSQACAGLLGETATSLGDNPDLFFNRIHPEDRSRFDAVLKEHLDRRSSQLSVDCRMRHVKGHYVMVHIFGVAMFSREGAAQRMVGSMTRLTEAASILAQAQKICATLDELANSYPIAAAQLRALSDGLKPDAGPN